MNAFRTLHKLRWLLALLLSLGGAAAAIAHEAHAARAGRLAGDAAPTATARKARPELGASAAFDAQGRLWAVYKEGGHVMLRGSADRGATWSPPRPVNAAPEPVAADGDARPKLAVGPRGQLYVSWTRPLAKPYTGEIRFAAAADGEASFRPPLTVHRDRQQITHRFDALTVTPDGTVVVAWIDKRDLQAAKAGNAAAGYRGAAVYFAASTDGGASFNGDHRLAEHSCECCRIALLAAPDGSLTAFWRHVFAPNVRDHAVARFFSNGRVEPLRRATFDDWRVDACPHHGPSLARDDRGRLHAVWFTQGTVGAGVFYGRLGEGRVEGQRAVGDVAAEHADLAVSGQRVAVVWKAFDGQRTRLLALRSDDGGATWRETLLATTAAASDQPKLLADGGVFYAFWNTRDEPLRVVALP